LADQDSFDALATIEQLVFQVGWLEQRRFAQDVASFGLTPAQFFVLRATLGHDSLPTMGTLAYDTLQHCATISGIVDRLEKIGLVVRVRDQEDRRQMLVEITKAGQDVLARVRQSREKRLKSTFALLSPEQATELLALLQIYLQAFRYRYDDPASHKAIPKTDGQ